MTVISVIVLEQVLSAAKTDKAEYEQVKSSLAEVKHKKLEGCLEGHFRLALPMLF